MEAMHSIFSTWHTPPIRINNINMSLRMTTTSLLFLLLNAIMKLAFPAFSMSTQCANNNATVSKSATPNCKRPSTNSPTNYALSLRKSAKPYEFGVS